MAASTDDRVETLGEGGDEVGDLRGAERLPQLGLGRVGCRQQQVLADGRVHQVGLLRDHSDDAGEHLGVEVAQVDPVDGHAAGGRVVQSCDERGQGRLARAGVTRRGPTSLRPGPRR